MWFTRLECHPINERVAGSIPGQGTKVGGGLVPSQDAYGSQVIDVSVSYGCFYPSVSPSLRLCLRSMGTSLGENKRKDAVKDREVIQGGPDLVG